MAVRHFTAAAFVIVELANAVLPGNVRGDDLPAAPWRNAQDGVIAAPIISALVALLATDHGLEAHDTAPKVTFISRDAMIAHRADATKTAVDGNATTEVMALYDIRTETILLDESWTGGNAAEQSILIHELVHHLQAASDRPYACPQEREKEAYRAQADWLARSGETLETAFGMDPMLLLVLTNCGV